jgi:dihydropteroate synthase
MQLHVLPQQILHCGPYRLDLSVPQVMGILNITPDSFSDGGKLATLDQVLYQAEQMLKDGAMILDVGGESTRPHASVVSEQTEAERVLPVIEAIAQRFEVVISVDTSSPQVFEAAAGFGATVWNDVRALTRAGALETAARLGLPVVLMHMRGEPQDMNDYAQYQQPVVQEVMQELALRRDAALAAGIAAHNIVLDMGFGFAKNAAQNLQLLADLSPLHTLGHPLLAGISRKRVLGEVLAGAPVDQRLYAGLSAALIAVQQGTSIIRTHDVKPTVDALKLWSALPV